MIPVRVERPTTLPTRWFEPFGDVEWLSDFDRWAERLLGRHDGRGYPADIWEDEESLHVELKLPGINTEDVSLSYEDGILRIEGEKRPVEHKGEEHLTERRFGKFVRTFQLPNEVDPEHMEANFKDGILHITLAKRPESRPRKIEIKTS